MGESNQKLHFYHALPSLVSLVSPKSYTFLSLVRSISTPTTDLPIHRSCGLATPCICRRLPCRAMYTQTFNCQSRRARCRSCWPYLEANQPLLPFPNGLRYERRLVHADQAGSFSISFLIEMRLHTVPSEPRTRIIANMSCLGQQRAFIPENGGKYPGQFSSCMYPVARSYPTWITGSAIRPTFDKRSSLSLSTPL